MVVEVFFQYPERENFAATAIITELDMKLPKIAKVLVIENSIYRWVSFSQKIKRKHVQEHKFLLLEFSPFIIWKQ